MSVLIYVYQNPNVNCSSSFWSIVECSFFYLTLNDIFIHGQKSQLTYIVLDKFMKFEKANLKEEQDTICNNEIKTFIQVQILQLIQFNQIV